MNHGERVAFNVSRDARFVILSARDERGQRCTVALYRRGASALAALLTVATGEDTDDGYESECSLKGTLEVHT